MIEKIYKIFRPFVIIAKLRKQIMELKHELDNSFWHNCYKRESEILKSENSTMRKIIKRKRYGDFDPFEKERQCLKDKIESLENFNSVQSEWDKKRLEELELQNKELLEIKAKYLSLLSSIKIIDSKSC